MFSRLVENISRPRLNLWRILKQPCYSKVFFLHFHNHKKKNPLYNCSQILTSKRKTLALDDQKEFRTKFHQNKRCNPSVALWLWSAKNYVMKIVHRRYFYFIVTPNRTKRNNTNKVWRMFNTNLNRNTFLLPLQLICCIISTLNKQTIPMSAQYWLSNLK